MNSERLLKIIEEFKNKKILVIGDIMLDKYIWGEVSRISPEAPVQVVNVIRETFAPGGASNVANNADALGAVVYMVGIVGEDDPKNKLINELRKRKINTDGIFVDDKRPTIQKIRIVAKSQQLLRVDYEINDHTPKLIEDKISDFAISKIDECDGIIISDYAKGVVIPDAVEKIISKANEKRKIIVVDPKPKHTKLYHNVTLITPNHYEASEMAGIELSDESSVLEMGFKLVEQLNTNVLITRSEKGMLLFQKDKDAVHIPTKEKEVYNIIGAGDTVVAVVTLALASGASLKEAAVLGNMAAGIKVGKIEDQTVSIEELKDEIIKN